MSAGEREKERERLHSWGQLSAAAPEQYLNSNNKLWKSHFVPITNWRSELTVSGRANKPRQVLQICLFLEKEAHGSSNGGENLKLLVGVVDAAWMLLLLFTAEICFKELKCLSKIL